MRSEVYSENYPLLVADEGDDYEVGAAFGSVVTRAEDRLAGFGMGMVVCAFAVAMLLFVCA